MSQRVILFPQSFLSLLLLLFCATYALCDPLANFQVTQPPPFVLDSGSVQCPIPILQRTFGPSAGDPEIDQYTPPTGCSTPNEWAGVTLTLNITSSGAQYPRLGFLTFQNVEIWRISTPIPVNDDISLTHVKDVTRFIPLFSKPGTFILELDNVVQPGDDGEYTVTLDATIFSGSSQFQPAQRADLIIPLTTLANNTGDEASVPPGFSVEVTLPQNAVTAFVELQASSIGIDANWYFQIPNQFTSFITSGPTSLANGPFREIRVLVDGQVAGVVFPYPVLSTGNTGNTMVSPAWSPIAPYGALDMPTYHLDLTPFIPILTNGAAHNITIDVASAEPDHQINPNWFLSGLLQVNLDSSTLPTTGNITIYVAADYATSTASGSSNGEVNIVVNASRSLYIEAEIISGSGGRNDVVFTQNMEFGNVQNYPPTLLGQSLFQITSGETLSTHNGELVVQDTFTYPLLIDYTLTSESDGVLQWAQVNHSYDRQLLPAPFIVGTTIVEQQVTGGTVVDHFGFNGTSSNTFNYVDTEGNTYTRQVNASNNAITFDNQGGNLAPSAV
ncbi:peptide N-acetyl-beta-D-glucosaminyl asparaginase amidase A-domain-containing protein [Lactarius indigo]|nr:peptide N-acetyl-beta-D-glucosaminyl asparaginase amidase A-domain-containing protein [Lactarius indigo]